MKQSRGFTLIELMIAILIFAMISTAAYKLFDSVSRAQQVTDGILDRLDGLQRTMVVIEKDLFQIAPRPVRDEFGDRRKAMLAPGKNGELLEFTRFGWRNPIQEIRSNMQRVAYSLEEDELVRYYWLMLDRAADPVVVRQVLMSDVTGARLKFMDEKKRWQHSWPPKNQGQQQVAQTAATAAGKVRGGAEERPQIPHAIELTLQHKEYGVLTTILPLLTYKPSETEKPKPDEEKGKAENRMKKDQASQIEEESDNDD
ncbi:type II secretion system minor pseudopilin GspJ [Endozoicomonas gorgoniicola]|uniref:Type II secretion system protein J n=1 Tax=Endozoicomonas gorgoniicola TaxID=1234144 RepID=A0ABT3MQW5_9GAMM|nr:type II secretion system minor pseudopilin GspJ [Endozoicomonas gorgoniicola]MCW7551754.1 type II secretion system minor pseudopilin GspJ [Endozoicomonas gorgoniicola]